MIHANSISAAQATYQLVVAACSSAARANGPDASRPPTRRTAFAGFHAGHAQRSDHVVRSVPRRVVASAGHVDEPRRLEHARERLLVVGVLVLAALPEQIVHAMHRGVAPLRPPPSV